MTFGACVGRLNFLRSRLHSCTATRPREDPRTSAVHEISARCAGGNAWTRFGLRRAVWFGGDHVQRNSDTHSRGVGLFGSMGRLKLIMMALTMVGLVASNIAAVLNANFHDRLYSGVRKVLLFAGKPFADSATRLSKSVQVDEEIRRQTAELRSQTADSEARRAKAEADLDGERAKVKRAHLDLEDVKTQRLIDAKEAKRVASSVRDRLARGAARSVAAIPAESVPYIGIGVTLSMVGLDLYDACETMREINGLLLKLGQGVEADEAVCGVRIRTREQVLARLNSTWRASYDTIRGEVAKAKGPIPLPQLQIPSSGEVRAVACPVAPWIPGC